MITDKKGFEIYPQFDTGTYMHSFKVRHPLLTELRSHDPLWRELELKIAQVVLNTLKGEI
jgi:hypothetical protein